MRGVQTCRRGSTLADAQVSARVVADSAVVPVVEAARRRARAREEVVGALVLLVIADDAGNAKPASIVLPGEIPGRRWRRLVCKLREVAVSRSATAKTRFLIERPQRLDVDRGADAGAVDVGLRALVHLGAGDELRRQNAEIEFAAGAHRGDDAPVDRDRIELRPKTANGHAIADAAIAVNGDAGHALQGFRDVLIRHLSQIFAGDGVDGVDRVPLDVDRRLLTGADAGDDDFCLVVRRLLGIGRWRAQQRQCRIGRPVVQIRSLHDISPVVCEIS